MRFLYKILSAEEWSDAVASGQFDGSAVDHADGFIHLSDGNQVRETAARHFKDRQGLVLVAFPDDRLSGLKWEPSRGGALFPHVYGSIPTAAAAWVKPLPLVDRVHRFPDEFIA
jgi:uncharacterized protein (DUF952 family)